MRFNAKNLKSAVALLLTVTCSLTWVAPAWASLELGRRTLRQAGLESDKVRREVEGALQEGNRGVLYSTAQPRVTAGLEGIGSLPVQHEILYDFTKQFLSGRVPAGEDAALLTLEGVAHPQLATEWIGVTAVAKGMVGKGKGLDSAPRKRVIDEVDLWAQSVQDQVARVWKRYLHHMNFETKGLTPGGLPSGAYSGDPEGAATPTISDVVEDTKKFTEGLPGSSSFQMEGPGAVTLGSFPDEARAMMVVTHINPELEAQVLQKYGAASIEELLDPERPVDQIVHRVAELNAVPIHKLDVTILTGDSSDLEALEELQETYHDLQFEALSGGTFQPALAASLGVRDGRVRLFVRRSGMTEAVFNTDVAGLFSADGAIAVFRPVSEEIKGGNDKRYYWTEHVMEKMKALRPRDWEQIRAGKIIFSSRQVTQPIVGAYTFLTLGRTDRRLPFRVPGVGEIGGDNYEAYTLAFASNPRQPGAGYLWLSRNVYPYADAAAGLEQREIPLQIQAIELPSGQVSDSNLVFQRIRFQAQDPRTMELADALGLGRNQDLTAVRFHQATNSVLQGNLADIYGEELSSFFAVMDEARAALFSLAGNRNPSWGLWGLYQSAMGENRPVFDLALHQNAQLILTHPAELEAGMTVTATVRSLPETAAGLEQIPAPVIGVLPKLTAAQQTLRKNLLGSGAVTDSAYRGIAENLTRILGRINSEQARRAAGMPPSRALYAEFDKKFGELLRLSQGDMELFAQMFERAIASGEQVLEEDVLNAVRHIAQDPGAPYNVPPLSYYNPARYLYSRLRQESLNGFAREALNHVVAAVRKQVADRDLSDVKQKADVVKALQETEKLGTGRLTTGPYRYKIYYDSLVEKNGEYYLTVQLLLDGQKDDQQGVNLDLLVIIPRVGKSRQYQPPYAPYEVPITRGYAVTLLDPFHYIDHLFPDWKMAAEQDVYDARQAAYVASEGKDTWMSIRWSDRQANNHDTVEAYHEESLEQDVVEKEHIVPKDSERTYGNQSGITAIQNIEYSIVKRAGVGVTASRYLALTAPDASDEDRRLAETLIGRRLVRFHESDHTRLEKMILSSAKAFGQDLQALFLATEEVLSTGRTSAILADETQLKNLARREAMLAAGKRMSRFAQIDSQDRTALQTIAQETLDFVPKDEEDRRLKQRQIELVLKSDKRTDPEQSELYELTYKMLWADIFWRLVETYEDPARPWLVGAIPFNWIRNLILTHDIDTIGVPAGGVSRDRFLVEPDHAIDEEAFIDEEMAYLTFMAWIHSQVFGYPFGPMVPGIGSTHGVVADVTNLELLKVLQSVGRAATGYGARLSSDGISAIARKAPHGSAEKVTQALQHFKDEALREKVQTLLAQAGERTQAEEEQLRLHVLRELQKIPVDVMVGLKRAELEAMKEEKEARRSFEEVAPEAAEKLKAKLAKTPVEDLAGNTLHASSGMTVSESVKATDAGVSTYNKSTEPQNLATGMAAFTFGYLMTVDPEEAQKWLQWMPEPVRAAWAAYHPDADELKALADFYADRWDTEAEMILLAKPKAAVAKAKAHLASLTSPDVRAEAEETLAQAEAALAKAKTDLPKNLAALQDKTKNGQPLRPFPWFWREGHGWSMTDPDGNDWRPQYKGLTDALGRWLYSRRDDMVGQGIDGTLTGPNTLVLLPEPVVAVIKAATKHALRFYHTATKAIGSAQEYREHMAKKVAAGLEGFDALVTQARAAVRSNETLAELVKEAVRIHRPLEQQIQLGDGNVPRNFYPTRMWPDTFIGWVAAGQPGYLTDFRTQMIDARLGEAASRVGVAEAVQVGGQLTFERDLTDFVAQLERLPNFAAPRAPNPADAWPDEALLAGLEGETVTVGEAMERVRAARDIPRQPVHLYFRDEGPRDLDKLDDALIEEQLTRMAINGQVGISEDYTPTLVPSLRFTQPVQAGLEGLQIDRTRPDKIVVTGITPEAVANLDLKGRIFVERGVDIDWIANLVTPGRLEMTQVEGGLRDWIEALRKAEREKQIGPSDLGVVTNVVADDPPSWNGVFRSYGLVTLRIGPEAFKSIGSRDDFDLLRKIAILVSAVQSTGGLVTITNVTYDPQDGKLEIYL